MAQVAGHAAAVAATTTVGQVAADHAAAAVGEVVRHAVAGDVV